MAAVQRSTGAGTGSSSSTSPDFDALFVAGYARLVGTVAFVCGDRDVAADCVADAFERAYVRWRRVSRLDDPLAWVRRVAINRATDVHRRRTRGRRALQRLAARPEVVSGEVGLSDSAAFHDGELAAAVQQLSPQQRVVVALHYLDDLSVTEVARAMSLSEGAVKFHLHQARARLRSVLRTDEPAGSPATDKGAP